MSEYKSRIYDTLVSASEQIDLHMIRLMLFPNSHYVDHWMHEIWSFLFKVDKLKGKNKYPTAKFIYDALSVHNDILGNYMKIVEDLEENLEPVDIAVSDVISAVVSYQKWIASELSQNGIVLQKDVKAKLHELTS